MECWHAVTEVSSFGGDTPSIARNQQSEIGNGWTERRTSVVLHAMAILRGLKLTDLEVGLLWHSQH
jgi:hypothetical protein